MPTEVDMYFKLFAVWATASSGTLKTAAWRTLVQYLVENPGVYQYLGARVLSQELIVEVERALLRALAAKGVQRGIQATSGSGIRLFVARLGINFAAGPKIPMPQAQLILTLAIVLGTFGQAFAESKTLSAKVPEYQKYLTNYLQFTAKAVGYHPWVAKNLAEPKDFDEWCADNR